VAGGAASAAETCGGGGATLAFALLAATLGVSFERAASCPQATHQKATSAATHIQVGL
jgi:trans-2-enoyl-CoA reductase